MRIEAEYPGRVPVLMMLDHMAGLLRVVRRDTAAVLYHGPLHGWPDARRKLFAPPAWTRPTAIPLPERVADRWQRYYREALDELDALCPT